MLASGRLRPVELAEAAVLGDLAALMVLAGAWLPAGNVLLALAVTPFVTLMVRHRLRAVLVGGFSSAAVGLLIGGLGLAVDVAALALVGAVVGAALRRRLRLPGGVALTVLTLWPPGALLTDGLLALLTRSRHLAIDQGRNSWQGLRRLLADGLTLAHVDASGPLRRLDGLVSSALRHWWLAIPAAELVGLTAVAALVYQMARAVLARLAAAAVSVSPPWPVEPEGAPGPVPARVIDVGYRYREGRDLALDGVSMEVEVGQYVAIVGPNGSGKSTLGRVVAGLPPTAGAVARPGPAGLGRLGGTAMVFQRPESQVLGARVKDDIRWGLPAGAGMDTGTALEAVGLAGLADRETATLSGGELQRVALAAALARRPALLVADEATAMLDADGRRDVVATLHSLVGQGLTVIAITHHLDEVGPEDVLVRLDAGRVVSGAVTGAGSGGANGRPAGSATGSATGDARGAGEATGPGATPDARPGSPEGRSLRLRGVGYVHAWRSPWAHRALEGIDLDVAPGEAVLVVGPNGAGKTTLGWVVAGLVPPTEGTVRFGPGPPSPGDVGIGFQHARLQLFRPTVEEDVGLGGAAPADVDTALRSVALDPDAYRHRLIDALSGGEQRRVALAGLLVRKPTLLVLDEPFAGLDPSGRAVLVSVLSWLVGSGLALLLISHDVVEGRSVCGRVLGLSAGRVSFDGPMGGADLDSLMATAPAGPAGT